MPASEPETPRALRPLGAGLRWQRLAGGTALGGAMLATPAWLAGGAGLVCPFLALTGLPCPLCGGTRTCAALVSGDWALAWQTNPGALGVVVLMAVLALQWTLEGLLGWRKATPWPWERPWLLWLVVLALMVAWAVTLVRTLSG